MWNRRSRVDPFTAEFRQAILEVGGETPQAMDFDPGVVAESGLFGEPERGRFPTCGLDLEA
jgi:hypothetical protein